jgi:hypothetical protein
MCTYSVWYRVVCYITNGMHKLALQLPQVERAHVMPAKLLTYMGREMRMNETSAESEWPNSTNIGF